MKTSASIPAIGEPPALSVGIASEEKPDTFRFPMAPHENIGHAPPPKADMSTDNILGSSPPAFSQRGNPDDSFISVDGLERKSSHHRSSSFVKVQHVEQTADQMQDAEAGPNANAEWVYQKGAWVIHIVLIVIGKMIVNEIPGISDAVKWTIVNLGYMLISYIMFHYSTGVPFESNAGVYDDLTLWEQIDNGAQYTPAKKYLTSVPIGLFLVSTHYSRYNPWLFTLNIGALLFVLFPKLPILHGARVLLFTSTDDTAQDDQPRPHGASPVMDALRLDHAATRT